MLSIVDELRTNRESGARRLEAEYKAGLMTLARRLCDDEGDAEELVNSTFADVIEGIDDYLEQSAFFGWMCKILENRFAKEKRRKSNRTVVANGEAVDGAVDENGADRIFQGVDAALLRDAIDDLPDEMKEALMLRYFMGLPVARVAKLLSVPEGTAKWRLHCARMILTAKLGVAAKKPGVKVLRIVTSNLLDRIAKVYPEKKVFGVSQSDCWEYCECAGCTAIDEREESPAGSNLAFVNAVAEAVAKKYPDVIIETLAYQYTVKPPKYLRPRDNVMVCLCTDQCDFSRPLTESRFHSRGRNFVDDLRTWCAITKNRVHLWDYTMNFQYKLHAFPNIYSLKGNLETFLDCGVTEVFEQGPLPSRHQAGETLKLYLLGHLLWDPRQPLEPLLARFYMRYYGKAGPLMRRYMEELHAVSRVRDETVVPLMMWGVLDSPALPTDFFEHGAIWLARAAEAVKDDPAKSRNVRWERNANDYTRIMRSGKPSPELAAAAARILEDWKNFPDSARISESDSICDEARAKLEQYAAPR